MKTKLLLAGCVVLLSGLAAGFDWPQFRGPRRDNVSLETGLLKSWPSGGPKLLWTCDEAGIGYSGPAIVGGRVYTMGADEKNDFVIALDAKSGKKVWSTPIGAYVRNGYGSGPRSTPTLDGDRLYALSSGGQLACLKTGTGEKVWSVSLTADLGGGRPGWNYCESPLVDGEHVVCTPGGARGTLAALDKNTGKVVWRSTELKDSAGYSSIVPATVGGVPQYVQQTMKGIAGVAAKDGRLVWYHPQPKYRTAVIPTPIVSDNLVYATAGYGAGDVLLRLTPSADGTKAEQLYDEEAQRVMEDKHEGVVLVGEHVYGWSDKGGWTCQELKTGKKVWQSTKLGRGSITSADGMLYCFAEKDGTTVLIRATPDGWQEEGRFTIPRHTQRREYNNNHWTHPVLANGRLYLRDQELIFCYDVKNGGS